MFTVIIINISTVNVYIFALWLRLLAVVMLI